MAVERWDESGKQWEDDHGLLEPEQITQCARADEAEPLRAPVPMQIVSNGDYMPEPQTTRPHVVEGPAVVGVELQSAGPDRLKRMKTCRLSRRRVIATPFAVASYRIRARSSVG